MIKVGILEAASAHGAELVRILLNHPDVELVWAQSSVAQGPITTYVRGIIGETDLSFSRLTLSPVDVIINCSSTPVTQQFVTAIAAEPDEVRIIETAASNLPAEYIYGLCELNRKPLVRGGRQSAPVSPLAMAVELALLPLAKHLLLNSPISVAAAVGVGGTRSISHRGGGELPESAEIALAITSLQSSFCQPVNIVELRTGCSDGLMAVVTTQCSTAIGELRPLYISAYEDHNFTHLSDEPVDTRDVVGTNKCLLYLEKEDDTLRITSVLDPRIKGGAGNSVHLLNLMFGLHEVTGLNLKSYPE